MLPIMRDGSTVGSFVQNIETTTNKHEVNSNYGIGSNVNKLQKSISQAPSQTGFHVGAQSAKNLGLIPATKQASTVKHTVPKFVGDTGFKIHVTGAQDAISGNARRSGLFKVKNGPELKGAPQISNLIIR
jgi:hypothetical protein